MGLLGKPTILGNPHLPSFPLLVAAPELIVCVEGSPIYIDAPPENKCRWVDYISPFSEVCVVTFSALGWAHRCYYLSSGCDDFKGFSSETVVP